MKRRRIRKYRAGKKNSRMKFLWIIGIMIIAIVCGYLTARYVVGPMLGYDTEVLKIDFPSQLTAAVKSVKNNDDNEEYKYALQYGVFSSEEKASALAAKLKNDNVSAEVVKSGNKFKVISNRCEKKEEALAKLKDAPITKDYSVFVTDL